jgi:hypothetical protein
MQGFLRGSGFSFPPKEFIIKPDHSFSVTAPRDKQ